MFDTNKYCFNVINERTGILRGNQVIQLTNAKFNLTHDPVSNQTPTCNSNYY
ncbi:MAG: hypothetical protein ACI85G_000686, partial [Psychroserpens sp.]